MKCLTVFCFAVALATCSFHAHGDTPSSISYQGRLLDGASLVSGDVSLVLQLHDAALGGNLLYEDSNTVSVLDGLYSTYIGDHTTYGSLSDALTNTFVYIQVVVNGSPLTPRERLVSVAYAQVSETVRGTNLYVHPMTGRVGVNNMSPVGQLSVGAGNGPYTIHAGSGPGTTAAIVGDGRTPSNGRGVWGAGYEGVRGWSPHTGGIGVYGEATSVSGIGVKGWAEYSGVEGYAVGTNWDASGVYGEGSMGVWGHGTNVDGIGVLGTSAGTNWYSAGVFGGGGPLGVYGFATNLDAIAVFGEATNMLGIGLLGRGQVSGVDGYAIGTNWSDSGVYGEGSVGLYGYSENPEGIAVYGYCTNVDGIGVYGDTWDNAVVGLAFGTNWNCTGVSGEGPLGVYGYSTNREGIAFYGRATSISGRAIVGWAEYTGVEGYADDPDVGVGVYGEAFTGVRGETADPANGWSGEFGDDVYVGGTLYYGALVQLSDARIKKDIEPVGGGILHNVMALDAVEYHLDANICPSSYYSEGRKTGFIAQDMAKVFPGLVTERVFRERSTSGSQTGPPQKYFTVNQMALIPLLVKAIQEQQVEIEDLRGVVERLSAQANSTVDARRNR